MRTAAILPVKRLTIAKQRLGADVADSLRLRLARAMVSDVLAALARAASIERTIVVTSEPPVAAEARERGALVLEDAADAGQSAAVTIGVARALAEGYERVLCHGHGVRRSSRASAEVVIVPDRHGTGTNGLLLTPPDVIAPSFGPGSCARHRALAQAAGAAWRLEHPPSLLLDVDTGADLAALRDRLIGDRPVGAGASAARTRAVLGQPERTPILSTSTSG